MTVTDPRPAAQSAAVRELLDEAAADYAAAEAHRARAQANAAADAGIRARAARAAGDQYDRAAITHRAAR